VQPGGVRPARGQGRRVPGASSVGAAASRSAPQARRAMPDRRAADRRPSARVRPGQLRRRRPGREAGLAAAAPARQFPGSHPPRLVHHEKDRGHGLRGVGGVHRKPDRLVHPDRRRQGRPAGLPAKAQTAVEGQIGMTADALKGKVIRIGGASAFWGDSSVGAPQLVRLGQVDYLVFDYLAELTMSILAAARAKDPALGYATDFVAVTMKAILKDVAARGIRVISNAGGVNPAACARALAALAAEQGVHATIAVVQGDDVMPIVPQLREQGVTELQSGAALPQRLLTANAYLGALPIRQALDDG